jgi:uncharacterized membrane protein
MYAPNENGTPSRSFLVKLLVRSWEYRYPRFFVSARFAAGAVQAVLAILLFSYGYWLGLLPLAAAAGAFGGGYWIYQITQSQPAT